MASSLSSLQIETVRAVRDRLAFLLTHRDSTPPQEFIRAVNRCVDDLVDVVVEPRR